MNSIQVECPKCGWVHFAVDEAYVKAWEEEWAHLCRTKPAEWLSAYGVTKDAPPTIKTYMQCFRCGNPDVDGFFETKKELNNGHTIQPILWEKVRGK